jgi:hypothetical protein
MTHHYVLEIRYGADEAPVRIELPGYDADAAELKRQTLATEIAHAVEIEAPLIYSDATADDQQAGVAIDPARVTSVDLLDPGHV